MPDRIAAAEILRSRSAEAESLVSEAWREWLSEAFPAGLAVLAVGGFGRRELFPQSDVDVLLLVDQAVQGDRQRNALSGFLRTLWDAKLRLSHSVRTTAECVELDERDVERTISLIDQTFLAGDWALYSRLSERLPRFFRGQRAALIRLLCGMARQRHEKFQKTIYHLEPNIKEAPGGMRDLHMIHWLAKLRPAGEETHELDPAREFLWELRCRLHNRFGRDQNVLNFQTQEDFFDDPALSMREYYHHARAIHRETLRQMDAAESLPDASLLSQFRDWRSRVSNSEFSVSKERVLLRTPHQLEREPELALRFFGFLARHGMRASVDAERRLIATAPLFAEYFAESRPVWPLVQSILTLDHAALALHAMHQSGFLTALFPEWRGIESLVIRDFYHRYTVDEHTLIAIEALEELRKSEDPARGRFTNLLAETQHLELVRMALLLHDVGKASAEASHAEASRIAAQNALERIQMPEQQREAVLFLIENHLLLSGVMNSRDLNDPRAARDLAGRVRTVERLKQLTLLTYADTSAVNPGAMTPWRLEQLWRVYLAGYQELTRELGSERIHSTGGGSPERTGFLEGFPTRYLHTHSEREIEHHMQLAREAESSGAAIELEREQEGWRAAVLTKDRPGLFASLAGLLSGFGMDILKAEAFANSNGLVLDTFVFADPNRNLDLNPPEVDRLRLLLQRTALGKEDIAKLLKSRPSKPSPTRHPIRPTIGFDSDAAESATLVEVVAEDRPGLLYSLASTFSEEGCNIEVVLIDTEAHKAIDVFYVTQEGGKLQAARQKKLEDRLMALLSPPA